MCTPQEIIRSEHICAISNQVKKQNITCLPDAPVCLFPISTLSFLPTGTAGLFCLFGSSYKWIRTAHTLLQRCGDTGTVPLQFTDFVSLSKGTQLVERKWIHLLWIHSQPRTTWNHRGLEESEIRRHKSWVEWDGQSPTEGEGYSRIIGTAKWQGTKGQGWWQVPVWRSQSAKFMATQQQKVSKPRPRPGCWDHPHCPESLFFPRTGEDSRRINKYFSGMLFL